MSIRHFTQRDITEVDIELSQVLLAHKLFGYSFTREEVGNGIVLFSVFFNEQEIGEFRLAPSPHGPGITFSVQIATFDSDLGSVFRDLAIRVQEKLNTRLVWLPQRLQKLRAERGGGEVGNAAAGEARAERGGVQTGSVGAEKRWGTYGGTDEKLKDVVGQIRNGVRESSACSNLDFSWSTYRRWMGRAKKVKRLAEGGVSLTDALNEAKIREETYRILEGIIDQSVIKEVSDQFVN